MQSFDGHIHCITSGLDSGLVADLRDRLLLDQATVAFKLAPT